MDTHNRMKTEQIGCSFLFYKCGLWFEVVIHAIIMMYTKFMNYYIPSKLLTLTVTPNFDRWSQRI
jgi:hypothetical protein